MMRDQINYPCPIHGLTIHELRTKAGWNAWQQCLKCEQDDPGTASLHPSERSAESSKCVHENFAVSAEFQRMAGDGKDQPMTGLMLEISANCVDCGSVVYFRSSRPIGLDWREPTPSFGHQVMNLPCYFANRPDLGLALAGYQLGVYDQDHSPSDPPSAA